VNEHIHPEGYIPAVVERGEGGALYRQVICAKALVLGAEAARHQSTDLWNHEMRGISTKTAAIYAAAYYEYFDQWNWDAAPTEDEAEALYTEHGGFLEMLNQQLPPEILRSTLGRLRPLVDPLGGGFTTLSHGKPARRGLFGFRR